MSYTRSFTKEIPVHYSGSVSYPASQDGGTRSYSGTTYETVTVTIHVDTDNFDAGIAKCNNSINQLTGAVVATESAQMVQINNSAQQISKAIINGFFKTVSSEISQQIAELASKIDSTLIHLNKLATRCKEKQQQMESDYHRISSRYSKIFNDLNKELSNRIFEIDRKVFEFSKESSKEVVRSTETAASITVSGTETGKLQAYIGASTAKSHAHGMIGKVYDFLMVQKRLDATLHRNMLDYNTEGTYYTPVMYCLSKGESTECHLYCNSSFPNNPTNEGDIVEQMNSKSWELMSNEEKDTLRDYFNAELAKHFTSSDAHSERVRENILNLFNRNSIKVCKN